MKHRMIWRVTLVLILAVLSMSAFIALADAPEAAEADTDGIELDWNGQGECPDDGDLLLDDALILDDGMDDGLTLDGMLDLQLNTEALLSVTDGSALGMETAAVEANGGVWADTEGVTDNVTVSGGMDNDALFEAWLKKVLPGMPPNGNLRPANSGRAMLDGVNLKLYEALLPMIREVAEGNRTSTEFSISADDVGMGSWWTAEELGLQNFDDGTATINALLGKTGFSSGKIMQALLLDCPYELYWFDKVKGGMSWRVKVGKLDGKARLSAMTAKMAVAVDYSRTGESSTYEVNDLPARVTAAVANIEGIVSTNADKDDLSKLMAYANEICRLVAYNSDAAASSDIPYGDPWQLVYIFDGDEDTRVVCEGYSKGFKYLCDVSDFDGDVACELMSGSIPTGKHMWNALRMPDRRVYLVDITNSDGGDTCNEKFFLKGCRDRTNTGFICGTLTYTYNENTLASFSSAWLTMSPFNYGEGYTLEGFSGTYDGSAHGISVTLSGEGTVSYGTEKGVYDSVDSPAWKDAGTYTVYFRVSMPNVGTLEDQAEVNIAPKTVGLSWENIAFDYDGDTHAPTATATGILAGDDCAVTVDGAQKNAGGYTATASALSNGNYALPEAVAQAYTIAPKAVALKWSKTNLTYNGKSQMPMAEVAGLVSGDSCVVTVHGAQKNAGSYTATATALSNGNYALPEAVAQAFTIAPKKVGLKWTGTSLTYNGKLQKPTAKATGLISGDRCTVKVTGGRKNAGSYVAKASRLSNSNYALPEARTKAFTIRKKAVRLNWTTTRLKYNGKPQKPRATAIGLIKGDRCKVTVRGAKKKKGVYIATATALSNRNYQLPSKVTVRFRIY